MNKVSWPLIFRYILFFSCSFFFIYTIYVLRVYAKSKLYFISFYLTIYLNQVLIPTAGKDMSYLNWQYFQRSLHQKWVSKVEVHFMKNRSIAFYEWRLVPRMHWYGRSKITFLNGVESASMYNVLSLRFTYLPLSLTLSLTLCTFRRARNNSLINYWFAGKRLGGAPTPKSRHRGYPWKLKKMRHQQSNEEGNSSSRIGRSW